MSLELGRFVAALLVVLFHVDSAGHKFYGHYFAGNFFRSGHAGVEFFFVLSGFIIFYVHGRDIGNPNRGGLFLIRRIIRIMPMYWLALAFVVAAYWLVPALLQGRAFAFSDYVLDFLLVPRKGEMLLSVAWTLRQEFVFYGIFLLAIIFPGAGMKPILYWQATILLTTAFGFRSSDPILDAILSTYNLGFGAGIAVAHILLSRPVLPRFPFLAAGLVTFLFTMIAEWYLGRNQPQAMFALGDTLGPIIYTIAAAMVVLGGAAAELRRPRKANRYILILGGSSYLLYLTHGIVASTAIRLIRLHLAPDMALEYVFPLLILCTVIAAVIAHILIEKPVLRLLRGKLAGNG